MPGGFRRVDRVCRRPVGPAEVPQARVSSSSAAPATVLPAMPSGSIAKLPIVASPRAPVYKAPPLPVVDEGIRVATWANVFGDYERRTGTGITSIVCCTGVFPPAGLPNPLNLSKKPRSRYSWIPERSRLYQPRSSDAGRWADSRLPLRLCRNRYEAVSHVHHHHHYRWKWV